MTGDGMAATRALDIDLNSENFHQDSAADSAHGPRRRPRPHRRGIGSGGGGEDGADFDSFAGEAVSLHDHLRRQAGECLSGADLVIADQIIEQIDETGYFLASLLDIAQRLGVAARTRSSGCSPSSRPSIPPASARAASPNASRCRRRTPTATIRRWPG